MFRLPKIKINLLWPLVILCIVVALGILNYKPDTFLTGWDNLHPEFNFGTNIKRSFFGAWQEYQGLGTVGGMGLSADLPRQILLYLASFILPVPLLRYLFHFAMLFVGTLGAYFFIKDIILYKLNEKRGSKAGFVGAMFYLFNLATLQMFYVPFEPFSAHFAFLPWLFYANVHYFRMKDRKSLFFLFLVNILAVTQNSVATYFYVYLFMLALLLFVVWRLQRSVREIFIALLILISVNGFWFFPHIYYVANKTSQHINAKVNLMATEDSFLLNKKYGMIENTAILKGFWFDNKQTDADGRVSYQMGIWREHLNNPVVLAIGYILFTFCLAGIYFSMRRKIWGAMFFFPMLLFAFIIVSNDTPVFSQIADLFYKVPLFAQVFRFPFTKFAILTAFLLSMYFSIFFAVVVQYVKQEHIRLALFVFFAGLPIILCYPMFSGKLIYDRNRLKIPQEYFEVFDFFRKQNVNERIATLPQPTYRGWVFYRWNYQGSGIIWNGIEQPTLERAFDVWGSENENYYHELSYAIYSGNVGLLRNILNKYQIQWLLVDESVINPNSAKETDISKLQAMIDQIPNLQLVKTFGRINVYRVNQPESPRDYVSLIQDAPVINPSYNWNNNDRGYGEYGTYLTGSNTTSNNQIFYPFRSLFTRHDREGVEFLTEEEEDFVFRAKIPQEFMGGTLILPAISKQEVTEYHRDEPSLEQTKLPRVLLDGQLLPLQTIDIEHWQQSPLAFILPYFKEGILEVKAPKMSGFYGFDSYIDGGLLDKKATSCDVLNDEEYHNEIIMEHVPFLRLNAKNATNCISLQLSHLDHYLAYLVSIDSRYQQGKSLLFWTENYEQRKADLETYLAKSKNWQRSFFIQPPMGENGRGYNLQFWNTSIGKIKTVNDLSRVTVNPIPYRFLTGLKIVKGDLGSSTSGEYFAHPRGVFNASLPASEVSLSVAHPNPSFYQVSFHSSTIGGVHSATPEVSLSQSSNTTLVLSQSFDKGWRAYEINNDWFLDSWYMKLLIPFFQPEIKEHVLVNNWANGWQLGDQLSDVSNQLEPKTDSRKPITTIAIVYLPQYLQYLGFLLLVATLGFLTVSIWRRR